MLRYYVIRIVGSVGMAGVKEKIQGFIDRLQKNDPTLDQLSFNNCNLVDADAERIAIALINNTYLKELSITNNDITDKGIRDIAAGIAQNPQTAITLLDLSGNDISDIGAISLSKMLKINKTIKQIRLEAKDLNFRSLIPGQIIHHISRVGVKYILSALQTNNTLEKLYIPDCKWFDYRYLHESEPFDDLYNALAINTTLKCLSFGKGIDDSIAKGIVKAINVSDGLNELRLNTYCQPELKNESVMDIIKAVKANQKITVFEFGYSARHPTYKRWFTDILEGNNHLVNLDLFRCSLGDRTISLFTKLLIKDKTLKELKLRDNFISYVGAGYLAKALAKNVTLELLDLSFNDIGSNGAKIIAKGLKKNKVINRLILGSCEIGPKGLIALASMLKKNTTLSILALWTNNFDNNSRRLFADSLAFNTGLRWLSLINNHIYLPDLKYFATSLTKNNTLCSFRIAVINKSNEDADIRNTHEEIENHLKTNRRKVANDFVCSKNVYELEWGAKSLTKQFYADPSNIMNSEEFYNYFQLATFNRNIINMCLFSYAANKNNANGFPLELTCLVGDHVMAEHGGMTQDITNKCAKYMRIGLDANKH